MDLVLRAIFLFFFMYVLTRLIGRRELSSLEPFDLILLIVLERGWVEGMQVNSIEPSPVGEASRNGRLSFELGHIPAGESFVLYIEIQVNPTNVGRRVQNVELLDGDTHIATLNREITVFP